MTPDNACSVEHNSPGCQQGAGAAAPGQSLIVGMGQSQAPRRESSPPSPALHERRGTPTYARPGKTRGVILIAHTCVSVRLSVRLPGPHPPPLSCLSRLPSFPAARPSQERPHSPFQPLLRPRSPRLTPGRGRGGTARNGGPRPGRPRRAVRTGRPAAPRLHVTAAGNVATGGENGHNRPARGGGSPPPAVGLVWGRRRAARAGQPHARRGGSWLLGLGRLRGAAAGREGQPESPLPPRSHHHRAAAATQELLQSPQYRLGATITEPSITRSPQTYRCHLRATTTEPP